MSATLKLQESDHQLQSMKKKDSDEILSTINTDETEHQKQNQRSEEDKGEKEDDLQLCRTPTGKESKIPPVPGTCPPAPKKKRILGCKRRLFETELIKISSDSLEQFFRPLDNCRRRSRRRLLV